MKDSTESRALLAWFLENYYRLDEETAFDSVCDGRGDKGVDGIYINHDLRQIDILQSKVVKTGEKTIGDGKTMKPLLGTLAQFSTRANTEITLQSANEEFKALAARVRLPAFVEAGYTLRGVLVTNGKADVSAISYLSALREAILATHKVPAAHLETVRVKEVFRDEVAWQGNVEVFVVSGHKKATKCFAWGVRRDDDKGWDITAVLGIPPVVTPELAVKAAIVSHARQSAKRT